MRKKILIIEDNEQNLYLLTFIFERHGYEVETATDGQTGIDKAVSVRPDMIVLDIQLPVMDGYAVASKLRSIPETTDIPVVAVTSYAMTGDREKAFGSGCDGYIEKPINPDTFMAQVEKHFAR
jgi:two-component system, cell cycle response regulator DivK